MSPIVQKMISSGVFALCDPNPRGVPILPGIRKISGGDTEDHYQMAAVPYLPKNVPAVRRAAERLCAETHKRSDGRRSRRAFTWKDSVTPQYFSVYSNPSLCMMVAFSDAEDENMAGRIIHFDGPYQDRYRYFLRERGSLRKIKTLLALPEEADLLEILILLARLIEKSGQYDADLIRRNLLREVEVVDASQESQVVGEDEFGRCAGRPLESVTTSGPEMDFSCETSRYRNGHSFSLNLYVPIQDGALTPRLIETLWDPFVAMITGGFGCGVT